MGKLQGKVALVTGGARGIGAEIVQCLAAEGASVAILDLDIAAANATASALGPPVIGVEADASDEKAMAAAAQKVVAAFGGLDIIVNNAGGAGSDIELGDWHPLRQCHPARLGYPVADESAHCVRRLQLGRRSGSMVTSH